jgi:hypothetical protein
MSIGITNSYIYLKGILLFTLGMKTIPTAAEHDSMLRTAFINLLEKVKDDVKPKGAQTHLASQLGVESSFISNIVAGRKNIGDTLIDKLDKLYPGWRAIDNSPEERLPDNLLDEKGTSFGALLSSLIDPNTFKRTLDFCYEGMSQEHKEVLVMLANRLHNIDHPESGIANPAGKGVAKKNKTQTVTTKMGTSPSGVDHARSDHSYKRVQK